MKEIIVQIEENKLLIELKKQFYEKEAVFAAAYKFTNLCSIIIEPTDDYSIGVYFQLLKDNDKVDLEKIAKDFCNEVLDQQVRLDLEKRYGNIKNLIVQQAFNPIKNLKDSINE
ncbi:MAG: His-Xaa-Ser system protein HxsD [Candidatus Micrarchaeia archaeon]|jgi:His-Xaa-Ser system protein HxsD|uniref:His-Xaa-Ser system protein HxsD n=1 Tax=Desulfurella sp. TaxID=1962857 RepID=UPI00175C254C|nr:His-Xaa-Ser system protein HxsD [Desulfurella sp.]HEX13168.1 His-Xaa-Ser system protein HxsD [Desulfurella acetivorans]